MYTLKLSTLIVYILLGAAAGAGVSQIIVHYSHSGPEDCASLEAARNEYHKPLKNSPSVSF